MIKKVLYAVLNILSIAAIVLALATLLIVVFTPGGQAPSIMGYSVLRVLTGSMSPTIPINSLVVVHETQPAEIAVGDVISFYSQDPQLDGALNTHRVAAVEQTDAGYQFTTQGDANSITDAYPVPGQNILGIVVFSSAQLGILVSLLTNPLLFVLLIAVPLMAMVIGNLYKTVHSALDIMHTEEQEAARLAVEALKKSAQNKQAAQEQAENTEKEETH